MDENDKDNNICNVLAIVLHAVRRFEFQSTLSKTSRIYHSFRQHFYMTGKAKIDPKFQKKKK